MDKLFYGIGDFFGYIFDFMPSIGNKINYFYIVVILTFLVVWTLKMIKHKKDGQ
jgi:tellurite resistance protein TehA-like permease